VIWQLWAPLLFVAFGVQMAPGHRVVTFLLVGGLKIAVAVTNLVQDLSFVHFRRPLDWRRSPHDFLPSGVAVVTLLCIAILSAFGLLLAKQAISERVLRPIVANQGP
jgi:hypothetical protein